MEQPRQQGRRGTDAALRNIATFVELAASYTRGIAGAVETARDKGATWEEVGEVLGVTKQAAQMRFGKSKTASST